MRMSQSQSLFITIQHSLRASCRFGHGARFRSYSAPDLIAHRTLTPLRTRQRSGPQPILRFPSHTADRICLKVRLPSFIWKKSNRNRSPRKTRFSHPGQRFDTYIPWWIRPVAMSRRSTRKRFGGLISMTWNTPVAGVPGSRSHPDSNTRAARKKTIFMRPTQIHLPRTPALPAEVRVCSYQAVRETDPDTLRSSTGAAAVLSVPSRQP